MSFLKNKITRYCENDRTEFNVKYEDKILITAFCQFCGNYIKDIETYQPNFICYCDERERIYLMYHDFINEIPEYTSGDELDDYIEHPEDAHQNFMKYIYNMVLFGITYENENYFKINDNNIKKNILKFLVNTQD
jgi:hypothetical protein